MPKTQTKEIRCAAPAETTQQTLLIPPPNLKYFKRPRRDVNSRRSFPDGRGFGSYSEPKLLTELGSVGAYYWGGSYYTSFVIDPKEDMVVIFMGQLNPTGGLNLDSKAIRLAYQAIKD
jgi:CubicO group peptidase (beta-lactamase class C family)